MCVFVCECVGLFIIEVWVGSAEACRLQLDPLFNLLEVACPLLPSMAPPVHVYTEQIAHVGVEVGCGR